jgi:penicillin-binding protein 2
VVGFIGQIPTEQSSEYDSLGYPSDALVGISGIEAAWERELRGTVGNRLSLFSITDERLRTITEKQATPGQSVYLTLNRDLQAGVQQALASAYSFAEPTWARNSPGAAVVVMDVNTGAILAMASYPNFDPAVFSPDSPYLDPASLILEYNTDFRRPLLNRATQGRYPLGSVFKLVSSVAGADSGLVPLDTLYQCTRVWNGEAYGDIQRTNWFQGNDGVLDGQGAIIRSCNPYYWQMGVTLNATDPFLLPNYARMLGFEQASGLRGVAEDPGVVPDPDWKANQGFTWSQADTSNLIIGQGELSVTPLQVARMVGAIANGGRLMTPYLVDRVQLIGEEPSYTATPAFEDLPIDPQVLADIRDAMCQVTTTPRGTANFIYQEWYDFHANRVIVCGKTGTAQAGNNQPHAWFAAFAPAEEPEIAIAVIVENSCEGSEVAAPIVRRAVEIFYGLPEYGWPALWQGACSEIVVE